MGAINHTDFTIILIKLKCWSKWGRLKCFHFENQTRQRFQIETFDPGSITFDQTYWRRTTLERKHSIKKLTHVSANKWQWSWWHPRWLGVQNTFINQQKHWFSHRGYKKYLPLAVFMKNTSVHKLKKKQSEE